ncbi:MAG TPA: helix-turn-helix domain-containing protein [Bryobacteraceae bacterium]|nr:helix-turn-helix domain-containing protein [Bryobacteraceae bacterium]
MPQELPEFEFRRFWQRLQAIGLNAYEARSYLVLVGHPRFKALELAARAHVPRQKIYEVLDSLVEKGFAQVVQERTKLFSAIAPDQALPSYLARRAQALRIELADQTKAADGLIGDLMESYAEGQGGRGTLDFLRIVSDPGQTAAQFRRLLFEAQLEYLEFSRPPYAVDPADPNQMAGEQIIQACRRGVCCRILVERGTLDRDHERLFEDYSAAGVEIRQIERVPMKMAVMDARRGLLALLDPVITKPTWTSLVFEHEGMGEAMKSLFENYWTLARNT